MQPRHTNELDSLADGKVIPLGGHELSLHVRRGIEYSNDLYAIVALALGRVRRTEIQERLMAGKLAIGLQTASRKCDAAGFKRGFLQS